MLLRRFLSSPLPVGCPCYVGHFGFMEITVVLPRDFHGTSMEVNPFFLEDFYANSMELP